MLCFRLSCQRPLVERRSRKKEYIALILLLSSPSLCFPYRVSLPATFLQELRGNVRVFARVRPFLPSDNVGPNEVPAIVEKGDGVSCMVSKRLVGDNGKELPAEAQSFSFDKCFPPRYIDTS